jgi:hypothetical protein
VRKKIDYAANEVLLKRIVDHALANEKRIAVKAKIGSESIKQHPTKVASSVENSELHIDHSNSTYVLLIALALRAP